MAMKTNRSNPSDISDIMVKSTFEDLKDLADMPNLGANSNDAIAMHSIGRLAANMEFLMNKVAKLDAWKQTLGLPGLGSKDGVWAV